MIMYEESDIQTVLNMLNHLDVKGIENCKRVVLIEQILQSFKKEDENGKD